MVFIILVPTYLGCPGKRPLNGCSVVVVVGKFPSLNQHCQSTDGTFPARLGDEVFDGFNTDGDSDVFS